MTQIKNLTIIALLATGTLGSCKKSDRYETNPGNIVSTEVVQDAGQKIAPANAAQSPSSAVNWKGGNISILSMHFEGNILGPVDDTRPVYAEYGQPVLADLFSPSLAGTLKVPYGPYTITTLRMRIGPFAGSAYALQFQGSFVDQNELVPVQVFVDNTTELRGQNKSRIIVSQSSEYMSKVSLNVNTLTQGRDQSMLQNMERTNGTVVISNKSNIEAYRLVLANMQNMLTVAYP